MSNRKYNVTLLYTVDILLSMPLDSAITPQDQQISFRSYLLFWFGQILSIFGSNIVSFVLIWEVTEISGDNNTILSTTAFIAFIPYVIFPMIAGVLGDKYDKKRIIILADSLQALFTLGIIFVFWFGDVQIWHIMLVSFLRGVTGAFHEPVSFSVMALMVPKDKLSRMNGLNALLVSSVRIIAPVSAGFLMVFMDSHLIMMIDVVTFFMALVPLLFLKIPSVTANENSTKQDNSEKGAVNVDENSESFWSHFKEGIVVIKHIPGLLNLMIMSTMINFLFQPLDALLPNFIRFEHGGGKEELAYIMAAIQVGMFIGAIWMSLQKKWKHFLTWITIGISSMFIGYIALGIVPSGNFTWLYIVAFSLFLFNPIVNGLFQTSIQIMIPPEKMARIISVLMTVSALASPLGLLLSGPLADLFGSIGTLYIVSGIVGLLVCIPQLYSKPAREFFDKGKALLKE